MIIAKHGKQVTIPESFLDHLPFSAYRIYTKHGHELIHARSVLHAVIMFEEKTRHAAIEKTITNVKLEEENIT